MRADSKAHLLAAAAPAQRGARHRLTQNSNPGCPAVYACPFVVDRTSRGLSALLMGHTFFVPFVGWPLHMAA